MADLEDKFYLAALNRVPRVGSVELFKLMKGFGSAKKIWLASAEELSLKGNMKESLVNSLSAFRAKNKDLPEEIFISTSKLDIKLISIYDELYPLNLKEIFNPPMVLFYKGTIARDAMRIAMVGSRRFTPYGEGIALEFGKKLAASGMTVISGGARGIDTASHKGALKSGRTVAVLGSGLDVIYPSENKRLFENITGSGGAVISEYAPGTKPLPAFFPARNRIIAGLANGVLVVEAAKRSGSLITAELALSEGRDIFAVPGSIYSATSYGTNLLIQRGAKLVKEPKDILEEYNLAEQELPKKLIKLDGDELKIYQVLSFEHPLSLDEIVMSLDGIEISNLAFLLMQLVLKGLIIETDLHTYRRAERE